MGILFKAFLASFIFAFSAFADDSLVGDIKVPDDSLLEERALKDALQMPNYRDEMRNIVTTISDYAKERKKDFIIMTRQGSILLNVGEWEEHLDEMKIAASRGVYGEDEVFIEKLFNPDDMQVREVGFPIVSYSGSIDAMVVDYHNCTGNVLSEVAKKEIDKRGIVEFNVRHCETREAFYDAVVNDSSVNNAAFDIENGFRYLPKSEPIFVNPDNITGVREAKNMLILTNLKEFDTKDNFILAMTNTNYDLLVTSAFFRKEEPLTKDNVTALKYKKLGAKRLVLAKIDVSRISPDDFYFKKEYKHREPKWIKFIDERQPDRFIVEYYSPEFKSILGKYIKGVVDLGFDGVMLDGVDAHLIFEKNADID